MALCRSRGRFALAALAPERLPDRVAISSSPLARPQWEPVDQVWREPLSLDDPVALMVSFGAERVQLGRRQKMTETPEPNILPESWAAISRYRSPRLGWGWLGISDRARADRMERLLKSTSAKRAAALLREADDKNLAHLEAIATINSEQAEAAFRRTFVFNVSAPIAVVAALAQLAPQDSAALLADAGRSGDLQIGASVTVALVVGTVLYTFLRARDARDLADIVALESARRRTC
jgi:hypothetical protein